MNSGKSGTGLQFVTFFKISFLFVYLTASCTTFKTNCLNYMCFREPIYPSHPSSIYQWFLVGILGHGDSEKESSKLQKVSTSPPRKS